MKNNKDLKSIADLHIEKAGKICISNTDIKVATKKISKDTNTTLRNSLLSTLNYLHKKNKLAFNPAHNAFSIGTTKKINPKNSKISLTALAKAGIKFQKSGRGRFAKSAIELSQTPNTKSFVPAENAPLPVESLQLPEVYTKEEALVGLNDHLILLKDVLAAVNLQAQDPDYLFAKQKIAELKNLLQQEEITPHL